MVLRSRFVLELLVNYKLNSGLAQYGLVALRKNWPILRIGRPRLCTLLTSYSFVSVRMIVILGVDTRIKERVKKVESAEKSKRGER
jgi:hypothetical protein